MAAGKGIRIGIALGAGEVAAVVFGRPGAPTARVPLSMPGEGPNAGSLLKESFQALKDTLDRSVGSPTTGAQIWVAVLPPLADSRVVSLPPMAKSDVEAVLTRDVARYFLGAAGLSTVGVRMPAKGAASEAGSENGGVPVLASAVATDLLERVRSALESVGWRVRSFSSAHAAWMEAAVAMNAPVDGVVAVLGENAHLIRLHAGAARGVRQLPAADTGALTTALGEKVGTVLILASPQTFDTLGGQFRRAGWRVVPDPEGWASAEEAAGARAEGGGVELIPPSLARDRTERTRRNALALVGAAAVLIFASLGAQLWGANRELGSIQDQRAAIRSEVEPLLAARDSLNVLTAQVQSMEELASSAPVWTRSLVELSALLPEETYLTGFFASGDTVELEASGTEAGVAIQALREAGIFQEVRLQGLVERDLEEGETVTERFRLWARLPGTDAERRNP